MTHRLTRHFYKDGFNDFLFNHFGIHPMHLGAPGAALDSTGHHAMAGGAALSRQRRRTLRLQSSSTVIRSAGSAAARWFA
jgi:hypothetical protein